MNPAAERRQRPSPGSRNPVEAPAPGNSSPEGPIQSPVWVSEAVMDGLGPATVPVNSQCEAHDRSRILMTGSGRSQLVVGIHRPFHANGNTRRAADLQSLLDSAPSCQLAPPAWLLRFAPNDAI